MASTALSKRLSDKLKFEIVACFWRKEKAQIELQDYVSYFENYGRICSGIFLGLHSEEKASALKTHEGLISTVKEILLLVDSSSISNFARRSQIRSLIVQGIPNSATDDETKVLKNNSINLVLRLWLHIHVQDPKFSPVRTLQWDDTSSLQEFVRTLYPIPNITAVGDGRNEIIDARFNAANLFYFCGIGVKWTCILTDHLKFDRQQKLVQVFSLKRCLQDQLDINVEITPRSVLRETILSLDLLFPIFDIDTAKYLKRQNQILPFVSTSTHSEQVYLSDFYHWRDRLAELYWEFQSPPPGWRQLVQDRRNPLQYYTFWFAAVVLALTVLFGAISSITAVMQTRFTYEGLLLARAAASSSSPCTC